MPLNFKCDSHWVLKSVTMEIHYLQKTYKEAHGRVWSQGTGDQLDRCKYLVYFMISAFERIFIL